LWILRIVDFLKKYLYNGICSNTHYFIYLLKKILLKIIYQNSIPLSLLYKVNCDILEIKILYKLGENLTKNEFARAFTSNNSQN
jgi:hypothetical protein